MYIYIHIHTYIHLHGAHKRVLVKFVIDQRHCESKAVREFVSVKRGLTRLLCQALTRVLGQALTRVLGQALTRLRDK